MKLKIEVFQFSLSCKSSCAWNSIIRWTFLRIAVVYIISCSSRILNFSWRDMIHRSFLRKIERLKKNWELFSFPCLKDQISWICPITFLKMKVNIILIIRVQSEYQASKKRAPPVISCWCQLVLSRRGVIIWDSMILMQLVLFTLLVMPLLLLFRLFDWLTQLICTLYRGQASRLIYRGYTSQLEKQEIFEGAEWFQIDSELGRLSQQVISLII